MAAGLPSFSKAEKEVTGQDLTHGLGKKFDELLWFSPADRPMNLNPQTLPFRVNSRSEASRLLPLLVSSLDNFFKITENDSHSDQALYNMSYGIYLTSDALLPLPNATDVDCIPYSSSAVGINSKTEYFTVVCGGNDEYIYTFSYKYGHVVNGFISNIAASGTPGTRTNTPLVNYSASNVIQRVVGEYTGTAGNPYIIPVVQSYGIGKDYMVRA